MELYHEEYAKPLQLGLNLLEKSNIVFYGPEEYLLRDWRFLCMIPLQTLHYISLTAYIVKLLIEGGDLFEKPDMIPLWLVNTEYWIKSLILLFKREEMREVINKLGSTWRSDGLNKKQTLIKNVALKRLYYGEKVFIKLGQVVAWQYLLLPLYETVIRKLVLNQSVELELPMASLYPFKITSWPVYLAVYFVQIYCTFRVVYVYLGVGWLTVVLTSHLIVKFLLLQEDLKHIYPKQKGENKYCNEFVNEGETTTRQHRSSDLFTFVKRHQNSILLTHKLDECFNKLTFTILLFATLIICFFALAGKASSGSAHAVKNYGAIIIVMMNIFILCYYSQLLSFASRGIALAAADTLWYKGGLNYQKIIHIVIMRSQKPCSLTTFRLFPIGLETFNMVVKTTWSYFSLVSQLYDERD
uniref:Odorant receptor n=1 Tax=Glyphodes pyloalis TaxID=1242752 RepID=A0A6M3GVG6_GLYPY|nr:olfactory receptor [Glyphodes pyloalis]